MSPRVLECRCIARSYGGEEWNKKGKRKASAGSGGTRKQNEEKNAPSDLHEGKPQKKKKIAQRRGDKRHQELRHKLNHN